MAKFADLRNMVAGNIVAYKIRITKPGSAFYYELDYRATQGRPFLVAIVVPAIPQSWKLLDSRLNDDRFSLLGRHKTIGGAVTRDILRADGLPLMSVEPISGQNWHYLLVRTKRQGIPNGGLLFDQNDGQLKEWR